MSAEDMQAAMRRAASDEQFRAQLLNNPDGALQGYNLTGAERATLSALPESLVETIRPCGVIRPCGAEDFVVPGGAEEVVNPCEVAGTISPCGVIEGIDPCAVTEFPGTPCIVTEFPTGPCIMDSQDTGTPYEDIIIQAGPSMPTAFWDWIKASMQPRYGRDPGIIGMLAGILIGLSVFAVFVPDPLFDVVSRYLGSDFASILDNGVRGPVREALDLDESIFDKQDESESWQAEPTPQGTEPPASTEGEQPSGGSGGDQSGGNEATEEPTGEPSADLCASNGGIQYQGEVCVCAGFVDKVTVCNDGSKIDQVTEQTCSPDPAACQDEGGGDQGGGGGKPPACEVKPCGNGVCQPECGENPNNCPADCP